jgi:tetratricopeptide (TPR) repeat protein
VLLSCPRLCPRGALSLFYIGRQAQASAPAVARRAWEGALTESGPAAPRSLRVEILLELALARLHEGRRPEARARLEQAMEADGYEVWKKALWLQDQGRLADALALLEDLAARQPGRADYRTDLGIALALAGRWRESQAQFERALGLAPDDARSLLNLGVLLERAGREREALRIYDQALECAADPSRRAPDRTRYWLHIALLRDALRARLASAGSGGKMR